MEFNKKLSKGGSITLPSALRREYGLAGGEKFKIFVDTEDGSILLQRIQGQCMFCGSDKRMIVFYGRFICSACVELMGSDVADRQLVHAFVGESAQEEADTDEGS